MRGNKGITLTSVIIYVIGMLIVVGTIANLTSFFYKNINQDEIQKDTTSQYTKFSSIFLEEINNKDNYIIDCKTKMENGIKQSYIIFSSGNQYTYTSENGCVYKNNVKICEYIDDCDFSYVYRDSKYIIKVNFRTKSVDMTGDNAIVYYL